MARPPQRVMQCWIELVISVAYARWHHWKYGYTQLIAATVYLPITCPSGNLYVRLLRSQNFVPFKSWINTLVSGLVSQLWNDDLVHYYGIKLSLRRKRFLPQSLAWARFTKTLIQMHSLKWPTIYSREWMFHLAQLLLKSQQIWKYSFCCEILRNSVKLYHVFIEPRTIHFKFNFNY